MYLDAINNAESGMKASHEQVKAISNNIANMQTIAFKRATPVFSEVVAKSGSETSTNVSFKESKELLHANRPSGVRMVELNQDFTPGRLELTGNPLDIAVNGKGLIVLEGESGEEMYTRFGKLSVNENGYLSTIFGDRLSGNIMVPPDATSIEIKTDGRVYVRVSGEDSALEIGQIELVNFNNNASLENIGNAVLKKSDAAGEMLKGIPAEEGFGEITQGFVELSNVDIVREMSALMVAQKNYQANARVLSVADALQETLINILR